jgi:erythromycin esterase-like protein
VSRTATARDRRSGNGHAATESGDAALVSRTLTSGAIEEHCHAITGEREDYEALLDLVGDRRFVLVGEASHGTHDFYRERARITRRLIDERGFSAVAVEADWPDAYRVNRYVMGLSGIADAYAALSDFRRFPAWMWRNHDVLAFVEWLRARNDAHVHPATKARFYGLDLYSLRASMEAVVDYLDRVDPQEASRARQRYSCFDHVGGEGQAYGYALAFSGAIPCENEVVAQLIELRRRAAAYLRRDGWIADDEFFFAEQNARLVRDAEEYYQQMYRAEVSSWNLRDRHMAGTLDALIDHLDRQLPRAKVVVWEHNSHVGDARATEMGARGELNVG